MRSPGPAFDLRAALSAEIHAAIGELEADSLDAKAVHRARVRLKRARALARVGRVGAPGLATVFNDSARACMHALAPARDAAALAEAARSAAGKVRKKAGKTLKAAAQLLDQQRRELSPAEMESVRTNLRDLLALAQVWPEASPRQIHRGAVRIAKRAKRARAKALGGGPAELRHVWRKREKQRLYVADILGPAWPRRRKRRLTEKLCDLLGNERDAGLLAERLAGASEQPDKRALRAMQRRRQHLRARADRLGHRLGRL